MAFDSKMYRDPYQSIKFEREYIPCWGCQFLGKMFDVRFCEKGFDMTKKCDFFVDENHGR
jgi:hypothetical protein